MKFLILAGLLVLPLAAGAQTLPDPAPLSQMDLLARDIGRGIGQTALDARQQGAFAGGFLARGEVSPSGAQDSTLSDRGLVTGWGFANGVTPFIGYAQGRSELEDDLHEARIRSYFLGAAYAGQRAGLHYGAAVFVGRTHNKLSSPGFATGSADHDGRLLGLSLRADRMLRQGMTPGTGLDLRVAADVIHHQTRDYALNGLQGRVDDRASTATALHVELGAPMRHHGLALRPYAAWEAFGGKQDGFDYAKDGLSRRVEATDLLSGHRLALGLDLGGGAHPAARIEARQDSGGALGLAVTARYGF
ncbi:hypothetical protein [Salipiger marinus]|uniref:hypothetical protein n=1 Tax=Salipiger marinus TaxID=555512 RepID=UPI004059843A